MANETPKAVQTESLITQAETPVVAQPTQSITAASVRKPKNKRGRPKKSAAAASQSSLTRTTTRNITRGKVAQKQKKSPPAPKMTVLNRLVNLSVVVAVFVTALAIQWIVPTEPVNTPKVETLPAQTATTAATSSPETTPVPATTPDATPATAVAPAPTQTPDTTPSANSPTPAAAAPKVATTDGNPPAAPTPKPEATPLKVVRKHNVATRLTKGPTSHSTPLNSGGTEDLDSEIARQEYMAKTKLATRTPIQNK